jgi:methyl-accepting chemotaxis protein
MNNIRQVREMGVRPKREKKTEEPHKTAKQATVPGPKSKLKLPSIKMNWKLPERMKGMAKRGKEDPGERKGSTGFKKSPKEYLSLIKEANPVKSVGMKLFLIFFITIMIAVVSLGTISYATARNTIEQNAALAYQQTVNQTSEKLDIILERFLDTSTQIFFDTEIADLLRKVNNPDASSYDAFMATDSVTKKLTNVAFNNKAIDSIYLYPEDPNGVIMGTGNKKDVRKEPWFNEMLQNTGVRWLPTEVSSSGIKTYRLVRSMNDLSVLGSKYVLVMELKLSSLEEQLEGLNLGDGGAIHLVTKEGIPVGSSQKDLVGNGQTLDYIKDLKDPQGSNMVSVNFNGMDQEVLSVHTTLGTSQWILNGIVPVSALLQSTKGILILTWVFVVAAAIVAMLLGWWMVRMIGQPLKRMKDLMNEGAKGNLGVRTDYRSRDEIGQLSTSFNEMMEQITGLVQQTNSTAKDVLLTASELSDASKKTAVSAREIAVATEEIANGASSLATEAERGNTLTDNITRQMESVIAHNNEMGEAARDVGRSSETGSEQLKQLMSKTKVTEETTRSLVAKVDKLKGTTSTVFQVLDALQNITKQTNILSLNATIEAARAGAAGRGFMVVADEIRQLADQSRQSIIMAGGIVDNIVTEMNETVEALTEAYPLFRQQIEAVEETSEIFQSVQQQMKDFISSLTAVTGSIEELNQSQEVLSDAMGNVSAVAEQSSATSEEVASLSSEQENVANQLVQLSEKLENVSGSLQQTLSNFRI